MAEFRPAIVKMYEKGKSIREISALFDVPYTTAQNALRICEETGSNADRHRSGRPRISRNPKNVQKTKSRIK